jgi:hypothetical protein
MPTERGERRRDKVLRPAFLSTWQVYPAKQTPAPSGAWSCPPKPVPGQAPANPPDISPPARGMSLTRRVLVGTRGRSDLTRSGQTRWWAPVRFTVDERIRRRIDACLPLSPPRPCKAHRAHAKHYVSLRVDAHACLKTMIHGELWPGSAVSVGQRLTLFYCEPPPWGAVAAFDRGRYRRFRPHTVGTDPSAAVGLLRSLGSAVDRRCPPIGR